MPLYEYECQSCQQEFELLIRGSESPSCPQCDSQQLTRKLSVVAAHSSKGGDAFCEAPAPQDCGLPQCGGGQCMGGGF